MNRWRWVMLLVLVGTGVSWFVTTRNQPGKVSHSECLTNADCIKDELCAVTPKGDGFVTFGRCSDPCVDDSTCPNGWSCRPFVEGDGALYELGSKEAKAAPSGQRRSVCAPATKAQ